MSAPATAPPLKINLTAQPGDADRLLINQTISHKGNDFYFFFTNQWADPRRGGYRVVVKEFPARGRAITLTVEVNENELMNRTLLPDTEALRDLAQAAAEYVIAYIDQQSGGQLQQYAQPELRAYGY